MKTKSGKKRKVWVGYGVFKGDILTQRETGQLAIFSNLECAQHSYPYLEIDNSVIIKLYMYKEASK